MSTHLYGEDDYLMHQILKATSSTKIKGFEPIYGQLWALVAVVGLLLTPAVGVPVAFDSKYQRLYFRGG